MQSKYKQIDWENHDAISKVRLSTMQLLELAGLIAHGPLEPTPWASALQKLYGYLKCSYIAFTLRQAALTEPSFTIRVWGNNGTAQVFEKEDFARKYYSSTIDPFNFLPTNQIVIPERLLKRDQWLAGDYFKQFLEPFNIHHLMGANIVAGNGAECRFRACRPKEGGFFSKSDQALCELLLPHLINVVHLHSYLDLIKSEKMLYAHTVDCMQMGVVIVDETAMVLSANGIANKILEEKDGIKLVGNKIMLHCKKENKDFQSMVNNAVSRPPVLASNQVGNAIPVSRPSGRDRLGVLIRATPRSERLGQKRTPAGMIFIRDPERKTLPSGEMLQRLFGFTPAEAALAKLLAQGLNVEAAAIHLCISKNTVRTQLAALFSKTGATRQSSLVQLLLGTVAIL